MSDYSEMREDGKRDAYIEKMRNWSCGHSGNCPCAKPDLCERCEGRGYCEGEIFESAPDVWQCPNCDGTGVTL